jgi:hypothetical protein
MKGMNRGDKPFTPDELKQWIARSLEPRQPRATQTSAEVKVHVGRSLEDFASMRADVGRIEKDVNAKIAKLEEEVGRLRAELQRAVEKADVITLPALPLRRRSSDAA